MSQLEALKGLTPETPLGVRPGLAYRVRRHDGSVIVESCGRRITFPAYVEEAVAFSLSQSPYRLRDLPGELDQAGRLALGRRLVREGLVWILPAEDPAGR